MAMSKGMKIGLSVAAVGITGTIVYMLIKKMKAKKEALLELDDKIIRTPVSTTPVSTPPTSSVGNAPFTNKTQGNAFRAWINDTYPAYAKGIDLDRTGSYNNSYINKAWEAYGSAYETARTNALQGITTPVASTPISTSPQAVPFTNRTEGNAFRAWINDTYPAYASQINLDRTGSYNNSYIKKAWSAYGNIYLERGYYTGTTTPVARNGSNIPPFSAAVEAQALRDSMDGVMTNDDEFWDITDSLSSSQKEEVKAYFNAYLGGVDGSKLCNWIEGDFSFGDERKALAAWGYPNDAGYTESNCNPPTPWYMQ